MQQQQQHQSHMDNDEEEDNEQQQQHDLNKRSVSGYDMEEIDVRNMAANIKYELKM
jgi:hypothetical protein